MPICEHMRTMVLVFLPTELGHKKKVNVGKYSSTMEHMGWITLSHIANHQTKTTSVTSNYPK